MEFQTFHGVPASVIKLLKATTLGTQGAMYKHLNIEERISHLDNPISFFLLGRGRCLGNITLCNRACGLYLRYFAFDSIFQTKEKTIQGKDKNSSELKIKVREFLDSKSEENNAVIWGYIDPKNTKSSFLADRFGFKESGFITTQTFSRIHPKTHHLFKVIPYSDHVKSIINGAYSHHQFYFKATHSDSLIYGLMDGQTILCLAIFEQAEWEIKRLPGSFGSLLVKALPYIPYFRKLIRPKSHKFLVPECVCNPSKNPKNISFLFESALAHFKVNSLIWWVDPKDTIYQNTKSFHWGLLNLFFRKSKVAVVTRGNYTATSSPVYVHAKDMI